jgi:phospholipase/carboxylesterase
MSFDRRQTSPSDREAATEPLTEACYVPQRYEPNYPYPLLVMLHARGSDEQQMVRSASAMNWRNYVGLSLRGPEVVVRRGKPVGFGWGTEFARHDRERSATRSDGGTPDAERFRKRLAEESPDPVDVLEDSVFAAIRKTRRTLHVHSERIFLVGCGEGAAVAYRLGLTYPERFAGVVAINGWLPGHFLPLGRLKACRDLNILVVHGEWNARARVETTRRDVATLRAGGLKVAFQSYPCAHRLTSPMLSDVDTWLINQCTAEL